MSATALVLVGFAAAMVVTPAGGAIVDTFVPPKLDLPESRPEMAPKMPVVQSPDSGGTSASPKSPAEAPAAPKAEQLPPELLARAERVISADPTLDRLLAGTDYKVERSGPWTHQGSPEIIGAITDLRLSSPVDARNVVLPGIRYNRAGTAYERLSNRASIRDVRNLIVEVDFTRDEVMGITPGLEATVTEEPGNRHFPSQDAAPE